MSNINRQALLRAAEGLLSSESDDSTSDRSRSRSPSRKRHRSDKKSKSSRKHKKHKEKHSKRHKRSEHDKIRELERKAASIGATSMLSRVPKSLSALGTAAGSSAGDAVVLDTAGDPNNMMFESLYAGSVPRYHRVDPMNLVSAKTYGWQMQLSDKDAGNTTANRYYRGRNLLVERSRQTKRLHLSDLRPKSHTMSNKSQQLQQGFLPYSTNTSTSSNWMSMLAGLPQQCTQSAASQAGLPAVHHPVASSSAAEPELPHQATGSSSSNTGGRRLVIPAPAFIPLEAPDELMKAAVAAANDDGDDRQTAAAAAGEYSAVARKPTAIDPEVLIDQAGLTVDEFVLKATRAWNIAIREHPEDEQLWLDFAAFQSVAARLLQQQRGRSDAAAAATAEKQVSLLSRGLTHHPHSESLLLALLRSYAVVAPDAAALDEKWKGVLARQPGSWLLWREYLALKNSRFASFTVSSLQQSYHEALHSMHMELLVTRRKAAAAHKQQHGNNAPQLTQQQLDHLSPAAAAAAASGSSSSGLAMLLPLCYKEEQLELQMVQLLLGLMYHELVAGYTEQVVAKIQAVLEYHLYQPPTPPGGASALLRLFAAFWDSSAPARIGEAGARGWAYWSCWHTMGLEPPTAAAAAAAGDGDEAGQQQQEEEPAGWSGWFEVPKHQQQQQQQQQQPKPDDKRKHKQQQSDSDAEEGEASSDKSEAAAEDEQQEDQVEDEEIDEVDLMLQLGIQLEEQLQEVEQQGLPTHIIKRWASEEAARSSSQWHPQRQQQQQPSNADGQEAPDPSRIVRFDAVEPCIFTIRSMSALRRLVLGSVELLGAPVGAWCSSNAPTPMQQLSPEVTPSCIGVTTGPRSGPGSGSMHCETSGGTMSTPGPWSDASADGSMGNASTAAAVGAVSCIAASAQQQQQQQRPWYEGSDERWQFLVSLLDRLVAGGPCGNWPELCNALLLLHARKPSNAAAAAAAAAGSSNGSSDALASQQPAPCTLDGGSVVAAAAVASSSGAVSQQQLVAVRAAAKQLLREQSDNLLLYDAYGCCEAAMQQIKTARKILGSALALATAASRSCATAADVANAAAAMPLLAVHLAQLELTSGGKGATERAHAALHACLAKETYQPAAAAREPEPQQQQQQQGLLAEAATVKARRGFQDQIQQLLSTAGGSLTPAAAATVAAAALYELTVRLLLNQPAKGLAAAAAVYKQVLAAVPEAIRAASEQHEQLQVMYCHMMVAAAIGAVDKLVPSPAAVTASPGTAAAGSSAVAAALMSAVSPAGARSVLAAALQLYPSSQALLNLQVWLDHSCYTLTGLRRQLAALTELNPSPGLWGIALQFEGLRPGGRVRLRALFERALAVPGPTQWQQQQQMHRQRRMHALTAAGMTHQQQKDPAKQQEQQQQMHLQECTAAARSAVLLDLAVQDGSRGFGSCSALWQQYIQYELSLDRPEAARKLFLRAVHECPGFKGLWLLGFNGCSDGMQPREASALMTAMQEREVVVRTDVYEVLLADMAEKQQQS